MLGEGGMGEVWRVTDIRLNRDVAIRILPEAFALDPDRMARLTRESQVLASLNHPTLLAGPVHPLDLRNRRMTCWVSRFCALLNVGHLQQIP
jgi:serine/threonine protein kinase